MSRKQKIKHRANRATNLLFLASIAVVVALCIGYMLGTIYGSRYIEDNSFVKKSPFKLITIKPPKSISVPILLYHYVEYVKDQKDTIRKSLDIVPAVFDNQVSSLQAAGYVFITPSYLNDVLDGKKIMPRKSVILSFDDGYEDFYTDVLPILKKYNVHAVEYVISGFIDHPNYMTGEELGEVIKSNLVEIGCHTVHHPNLAQLNTISAEQEISGCKKDLQSRFGVNTISFAYPYGAYSESLFPILKTAGFKNAVTTKEGTVLSQQNVYAIPRLRPGARLGEELLSFLKKIRYLSVNTQNYKE